MTPTDSDSRHRARKQIMLDQSVQGTLMKRVTTYWMLTLGAIAFSSWSWHSYRDPSLTTMQWSAQYLTPLAVPMLGTLLILPLAWVDMIRTSNRLVAPVHSMRTSLRRMMLGDNVPPIVSRPDDFWTDVINLFNRYVEVARKATPSPTTETQWNSSPEDRPHETAKEEKVAAGSL